MARNIGDLTREEYTTLEKSLDRPWERPGRLNDLIECSLAASNGDTESAFLLRKALGDNDEVFVQVVTEVRGIQTAYQKSVDTGEPLALPEPHHSTNQPRERGGKFRQSLIRHGGASLFR
jgi:hypothetical protein